MRELLETPVGRIIRADVFQPVSHFDDPAEYSITLVFEEFIDISEMQKVAKDACEQRFGDCDGDALLPFRDVGENEYWDPCDDSEPEYSAVFDEGATQVTFTSREPPQVVDRNGQPLQPKGCKVYPGAYARVSCLPFACEARAHRVVGFRLCDVHMIMDGDRIDLDHCEELGNTGGEFDEEAFHASYRDVDDLS